MALNVSVSAPAGAAPTAASESTTASARIRFRMASERSARRERHLALDLEGDGAVRLCVAGVGELPLPVLVGPRPAGDLAGAGEHASARGIRGDRPSRRALE